MKNILFYAFSAILITACSSETEVEESSNETVEHSDTSEVTETLVFDQNYYVDDWIEIRESILAADTSTLDRYVETTDTDARSLIMMCEEDWVRDELMELPYENLKEVDYNGELVKEFSAEIIEEFEGEEFGSAIYIYLKETKAGLRITGLMAAG